ncbi:MAG: glycosyltransferase [Alphaproteobacteria bacterium]|nr:glycosyltransferase [Alphaproteobacteria bacterium]
MAVRNGAKFLRETLDSLKTQSFKDFELIIVDDASTDGSSAILAACEGLEIRLLKNDSSRGLAYSLNRGIDESKGVFIARQDADDLALPDRFANQLATLKANSRLVLLGSAYDVIDVQSKVVESQRQPLDDRSIRWQMLFHNAFCHSTVMFPRKAIDQPLLRYDEAKPFAQDYGLWSQLIKRGEVANLRRPLLALRLHNSSMSATGKLNQQTIADKIAAENMSALLGYSPPALHVHLLRSWYYGLPESLGTDGQAALMLALELLRAFGHCGQEDLWAERILCHSDTHYWPFAKALIALAPSAFVKSSFKRLLRHSTARPDRVRSFEP